MTATNYQLPIGEILGKAWDKVYGAKSTIWAAFVIFFGLMFVMGIVNNILQTASPSIEPVYNILVQIVAFLIQMGMLYIGINRAKDLPISYSQMFRSFDLNIMLRIIGLYVLQVILLILPMALVFFSIVAANTMLPGGIITAIILGIIGVIVTLIITVRIMLSMALVLDKGMNPWEAIKTSFNLTRGNFWRLAIIGIMQSIIVVLSALPLFIGLIWSLPFVIILYGFIYKELAEKNA